MNTKTRREFEPDPERTALNFALTELLNPEAKETILLYLDIKHKISLGSITPLSREEIILGLHSFFGDGSSLILTEFNRKYTELIEKRRAATA